MADSSKRSVVMYGNRHGALLRANSTSIWDELSDADSDTESPDAQPEWRLKERMKTTSVALVLCLNIGTDPPDVVKPSPCARRECWIDPFTSQSRDKTLEAIGSAQANACERPTEQWGWWFALGTAVLGGALAGTGARSYGLLRARVGAQRASCSEQRS